MILFDLTRVVQTSKTRKMEHRLNITPWYGATSCKNVVTVVLMSPDLEILDKINHAMVDVHTKGGYAWSLRTIRCRSLSDIQRDRYITGNVGMDFVLLALDTTKVFCLEWARQRLEEVHPDMIRYRVVLAASSGVPILEMAVQAEALFDLQRDFNIHMFNANIHKYDEAVFLVTRLLTYFNGIIGMKTGMPNLTI